MNRESVSKLDNTRLMMKYRHLRRKIQKFNDAKATDVEREQIFIDAQTKELLVAELKKRNIWALVNPKRKETIVSNISQVPLFQRPLNKDLVAEVDFRQNNMFPLTIRDKNGNILSKASRQECRQVLRLTHLLDKGAGDLLLELLNFDPSKLKQVHLEVQKKDVIKQSS